MTPVPCSTVREHFLFPHSLPLNQSWSKKGKNVPKIHTKCIYTVPLSLNSVTYSKCHLIYSSRHNRVKDIVLKYDFGKPERQRNKSYFLGNTCNSLKRMI